MVTAGFQSASFVLCFPIDLIDWNEYCNAYRVNTKANTNNNLHYTTYTAAVCMAVKLHNK